MTWFSQNTEEDYLNFMFDPQMENPVKDTILLAQLNEVMSDGPLKSQASWNSTFQNKNEKKKRANVNHQIEGLIKSKITQRLNQTNNRLLYPILMGPHPAYTSDNHLQKVKNPAELGQKLVNWMRQYLKGQSQKYSRKKKQKLGNIDQQEEFADWFSVQSKSLICQKSQIKLEGAKYNKYTLQYKKDIVDRIYRQMENDGVQAKSIRFYVVKEANKLKIHPKNITRWLSIKDLDKKQGGRLAKYPLLEYYLANFLRSHPHTQRRELIEVGKEYLRENNQNSQFSFSKGWYERFRLRLKNEKIERSIQNLIESNPSISQKVKVKVQELKISKQKPQIKSQQVDLEQFPKNQKDSNESQPIDRVQLITSFLQK